MPPDLQFLTQRAGQALRNPACAVDGVYETMFGAPPALIDPGEALAEHEHDAVPVLPVQPAPDVAGDQWRVGETVYLRHMGQIYQWDSQAWYDSSFIAPPTVLVSALNRRLADYLTAEDRRIVERTELIQRAVTARDAQQYARSEKLARRILAQDPGQPTALAVLCATLRAAGKPQQALDETAAFARLSHPPLLISRAAALCDLGQWAEAKRTVGRALAIAQSDEAFEVVHRIKAVHPELYG